MSRKNSKKIVLLTLTDLADPVTEGISRKLSGQKKAWEALGFDAELIFTKGRAIINDQGQILRLMPSWGRRLQFFLYMLSYLTNEKNRADLLYIRYPFSTPAFIWFVKALKVQNRSLKIILEIPTMPYEHEFRGSNRWKWLVDNHYRTQLSGIADLAVVIGNPVPFPGPKTVYISNAVDIEADFSATGNADDTFRMLAVGQWRYWHGLDRLISGLAVFKQQHPDQKAVLTIIGEGEASEHYRKMAEEYHLWEEIVFAGNQGEEDIRQRCQNADIGIGVLGSFRKKLDVHAPLKHRTYAAAGLPFVYSTSDPDFDDAAFALRVPDDESPVDVAALMEFCKKQTQTRADIVSFAAENLSWIKQMKKVLDSL